MDSINSSMGMGPQMYALKKAIDTDKGNRLLLININTSIVLKNYFLL